MRREAFERESGKSAVRTFHNLITESVQSNADLTIFAGDITDSAMYASIDFVQNETDRLNNPYLYVTGNHDFEYGSEYFSKKRTKIFSASGTADKINTAVCAV
ncbi:hypothetical protein C823_002537 [Eubacterium plexicaudatum ASF492]|nr:hypothetical protein C823_002537 [Eubacterium plexicaudatum ASF492]